MSAVLPFAVGAAVYGFAFGILAAQLGFPWWAVMVMSVSVHAGASQIVALEQFATDGFVIGAILAGAAINLRYLGIVASLAELMDGLSWRLKLCLIHITGDESWAVTMAARHRNPAIGVPFLAGSSLTLISTWTLSTGLGAFLGQTIPDLNQLGLGFAFTAAFIAIARGMWRGPQDFLPLATTFGVTLLLANIFTNDAYAILIGSMVGVMVALNNARAGSKSHDG